MARNLFKKLVSMPTLKKAWHYVRDDARDDFMPDSLRYQDFAAKLDDNLKRLSQELSTNSYQPQPLLQIDIPKTTLTVRPGSVLEIPDRIVTFAITYLLVPFVDSKMSNYVYSFRLKKDYEKADKLFEDYPLEKLPFLKRETIRKIKIIEDWPYLWPEFDEITKYYYEGKNYKYMAVSDISAYYENINHHILRDQLLGFVLGNHKIVNLLISMLNHWTWCSEDGLQLERGIPQGNEVSNFIGNLYLMPVDRELEKYAKRSNIKFARYMDDIKIFAKDEQTARGALLIMNQKLRDLHLNIQGSKTAIYKDEDIRKQLFDKRMEKLNEIISKIEKEGNLTHKNTKDSYDRKLQGVFLGISKKKKRFGGRDLRLFKRLITGYGLIRHPRLVGRCVLELRENPDLRLNEGIRKYFWKFPRNSQIVKGVSEFLLSPINKFEWQEAVLISALRYSYEFPKDFLGYLNSLISQRNKHWFVRANAILALSREKLKKSHLKRFLRLYNSEQCDEIKRVLLIPLCQLESNKRAELFKNASFELDPKINRTVHYFRLIVENEKFGISQLKQLDKDNVTDMILSDNIYKLFLLKDNSSAKLQGHFQKFIKKRLLTTKASYMLEVLRTLRV